MRESFHQLSHVLCCLPEWEYEKDLAVRTGRSLMTGD